MITGRVTWDKSNFVKLVEIIKESGKIKEHLPSLCAFIKENLATLSKRDVVIVIYQIVTRKISKDFFIDLGGA